MKDHRSHKRGWGFWLLILTVPMLVLASSLPGKNLRLLQEIDPSNHELLDIGSSKDLAIIAGGLGGTAIYDISNPKNPNPFNNTTKISYQIERCMSVNLAVYNVYGKRVAKLISGEQAAGNYTVSWNGSNQAGQTVSSGMYYYQLQTVERNISKK